jgi:hypothetical protein
MKTVFKILFFILALWVFNHPNTAALIKGLTSVFVKAPIENARSEFRAEAEKQAQKEAEARMKKIDAAIDAADNDTSR